MLLGGREIRALLSGPDPLIAPIGDTGDGKNSQVQPSSLDLRIGKIFLPEAKARRGGSLKYPYSNYALKPGETAVIQSTETVNMPADIAGFGFPPASVSSDGILMTNPGHVDPGFRGPLRFTVINMGREDFLLQAESPIVTLLLFRLPKPVEKGWSERRGGASGEGATDEMLRRLSADFVDFKRRAEEIATTRVRRSGFGLVLATFVVTVLALVGTIFPTYFFLVARSNDDREIITRLETQLQSRPSVNELETRIAVLEQRVADLGRP